MMPREFLNFINAAAALKTTYRHNYTEPGRRESVAEHSWRLALMAMLLKDDFSDLDIDKVVKMCLIHDLGEAITGDIPCFEKTAADEQTESSAISRLLSILPENSRSDLNSLYDEMNAQATDEAKLYKALDCLEAVISHNEADISTWAENEYSLQFTHGADRVGWSDWLKELKAEIDRDTTEKIRRNT